MQQEDKTKNKCFLFHPPLDSQSQGTPMMSQLAPSQNTHTHTNAQQNEKNLSDGYTDRHIQIQRCSPKVCFLFSLPSDIYSKSKPELPSLSSQLLRNQDLYLIFLAQFPNQRDFCNTQSLTLTFLMALPTDLFT